MEITNLVTEEFFLIDKNASLSTVEHYTSHYEKGCPYNSKYNVIFPHDEYNNETIEKYVRRFIRLRDDIYNLEDSLCFIYISQSSPTNGNFTIDNHNVITNVYYYLNKIYDLLTKHIPSKKFVFIVFDTMNDINEKEESLNENIKLYPLEKCDNWVHLIPQMEEIINSFDS
jgi:hypothetical protein